MDGGGIVVSIVRHKWIHIGESGVVYTECEEVRSYIRYIHVTNNDKDVTCERCIEKLLRKKSKKDGSISRSMAIHERFLQG